MSVKSRKVSCQTLPLLRTRFQKTGLIFQESRNNVDLTKKCFLKQGCVRMRKYAQTYYVTSVSCMVQHFYIVNTVIEKL